MLQLTCCKPPNHASIVVDPRNFCIPVSELVCVLEVFLLIPDKGSTFSDLVLLTLEELILSHPIECTFVEKLMRLHLEKLKLFQ